MPFSFNDMSGSTLPGEAHAPASAMDVSSSPPACGLQFDIQHHDDMGTDEDGDQEQGEGVLGYQGWAARRLIIAGHKLFLEGRQIDTVAESLEDRGVIYWSLEHRGVIYWSLCNMDTNTESSSCAADDKQRLMDEDTFHDGLTDFYHVWTLAEAFLLGSMPLPAAPLLRWLKMYCQSNEDEDARYELNEAEAAALKGREANSAVAEITATYWKALRSLVVGVFPRRAADMLRRHPRGQDNAEEVGALARQLEKMPLLLPERTEGNDDERNNDGIDDSGGCGSKYSGLDREEYFQTWTRWQRGCKSAASSFGVFTGTGDESRTAGMLGGGGGDEERRQLRWLWGTICGERGCLEEGTESWAGLFAAVLAYERPDVRTEDVASLLRDCARRYPAEDGEGFLLDVISDSSTGAVDATLRFAQDTGGTLALSACAAHLVDLLARAKLPAVTNAQRSWFFRRLANRLNASPCGGWELAAAYVSHAADAPMTKSKPGQQRDTNSGLSVRESKDHARLLEMANTVTPGSERAAHELVDWCRVNCLGDEAAATVCRARGASWLGKTGLSAAAMGTAAQGKGTEEDGSIVAPGACGKAAYWLAKAGGGIQLERLCAEVSERLMVDVACPVGPDVIGDTTQKPKAVLAEAGGVLAAIPPGITGPELSFLERYKEIADLLMEEINARSRQTVAQNENNAGAPAAGPHARAAGALAVNLLAPRIQTDGDSSAPPPRSWAHLLRVALPALRESAAKALAGGGGPDDADTSGIITASQIYALLAKMQKLSASEWRVGSGSGGEVNGDGGCGGVSSGFIFATAAPKPYGFQGGREEVVEIRKALADCLGGALMAQNARECSREGRGGTAGGRVDGAAGRKRLTADTLIAPHAFAGL